MYMFSVACMFKVGRIRTYASANQFVGNGYQNFHMTAVLTEDNLNDDGWLLGSNYM